MALCPLVGCPCSREWPYTLAYSTNLKKFFLNNVEEGRKEGREEEGEKKGGGTEGGKKNPQA